jgi:hypothetical protein
MNETVTINGIEYVRKSHGGDLRIVILQRGWVVVGRVATVDGEVVISDASVVRKWGTTRGLGEIASGGPTSKTVLDPCCDVRVHPLAIVAQMQCEEGRWTPKRS